MLQRYNKFGKNESFVLSSRRFFMKTGDIIYAKNHADFLNKTFGTNYKGWMKSSWKYNLDKEWSVWMVRFNKTDGGWTNTFVTPNRIMEENIGGVTTWSGKSLKFIHKNKIVIEVYDTGYSREYIFRGLYKYDEKESNPYKARYYDKVADELKV